MTKEKVLSVVKEYQSSLDKANIMSSAYPHDRYPQTKEEVLGHCRYMLDQIEVFLEEDKTEKAMRWLGFIQGCLWCHGFFTVDSMKEHNKPQ